MGADRRKGTALKEVHVESWRGFFQTVLNQRYVNWIFRGHSDAKWTLETTLGRRFRNAQVDRRAWQAQEERILDVFKRKAHLFLDHVPEIDDTLQWLAIMQHHGAPTRLLDFTYSPYVAAFFALENATGDAAIWAVNHAALSRPYQLTIAGRSQTVTPEDWRLSRHPERFQEYTTSDHHFVVWDTPYVMNQRLIAQSGVFVVPGTLTEPIEDILCRHRQTSSMIVKFILATDKLRETAMFELYRMNITFYTLFPGLDGLARSMGFETEYHRICNPRTMKPRPGWGEKNAP